jgi:hypothetical protein
MLGWISKGEKNSKRSTDDPVICRHEMKTRATRKILQPGDGLSQKESPLGGGPNNLYGKRTCPESAGNDVRIAAEVDLIDL